MSQKDYDQFLNKINQLNKLVEFINESPERNKLVVNCKSHQEIVSLAYRWGFDISKRWGEN